MNRLITTTATVLVLLLSQSADAREARKGNHGADGKYREEIKAHMEEQRAENETFRAGLKNIDDDKRTAAIVEFREGQYAESVKFHEQIQTERISALKARLEENDKLSDAAKSDLISFFESQHKENASFRQERHDATLKYVASLSDNEELSAEERRKAIQSFIKEQRSATEEHRKAQHEETKAKMQGLRGDKGKN